MTDRKPKHFGFGRYVSAEIRAETVRNTFPSIGFFADTLCFGRYTLFRPKYLCFGRYILLFRYNLYRPNQFISAETVLYRPKQCYIGRNRGISAEYRFLPNIGHFGSAEYRYRPKQGNLCFGRTLVYTSYTYFISE